MAIMKPGVLVGQLSGKVSGVVFARNRGGDYVRGAISPVNPQTAYQVAVRNALSLASSGWDVLTANQRSSWSAWAAENPVRNRLGESIRLQGNAAYVALNSRLAFLGTALTTAPPTTGDPVGLLTVTGSFDIGAGNFQVAFTATPLGAGNKLWVLGCFVAQPARMFVKNRLRHFYTSAAAKASPADVQTEFEARFGTPVVGGKVVFRVGVVNGTTGQLSSMLETSGLVVST